MRDAWFDAGSCSSGRAHVAAIPAELPGVVIEIGAAPGEQVEAGQSIVVLESMKMEIPVIAERPGRLREVAVSVGSVVSEGDLLALLDCCAT